MSFHAHKTVKKAQQKEDSKIASSNPETSPINPEKSSCHALADGRQVTKDDDEHGDDDKGHCHAVERDVGSNNNVGSDEHDNEATVAVVRDESAMEAHPQDRQTTKLSVP